MLLVTILAVNVSSVDIADANCDEIIQCDNYGATFDGSSNLICNNAIQNSPDTEEVIASSIVIGDHCNSSDTSTDCMDWALNYYEELSTGATYHGNGFDRFGGITSCCDFADGTVTNYGLINDFNSDRSSYISREWSVIGSSDTIYDSCPTTTYNPQDITQTTYLNTFNISFLPFAHEFDQYVEPQFDGATVWNIQDYYLRNATDTYNYSDQIKEYLQASDFSNSGSWDIFDLFSLGQEQTIGETLDDDIEYIKDSCFVYKMTGCTDASSTSFSCTAGTGANVKTDVGLFLNKFFEKYKTPLIMQLGHRWYSGSTLSNYFTGYYYWETAYGIKDSNVLTYQGMRQYTNRTISRIQNDWVLNNFDAVFVVCEDDADLRVLMSEIDPIGTHTYDYDTVLDTYDLIVNETYTWATYNDEDDVVTTDSLFRFDWTNDGTWDIDWDDQKETEGFYTSNIDTSVATAQLTMDTETWGKGGTDSELNNYRVYNNPYIGFTSDFDTEGEISGSLDVDAFGTGFYDIGDMDYYCVDFTTDGTYDLIYKKTSFTDYNCSTDVFSIVYTDSNLYDNDIIVQSSDYLQTVGSYTLSVKGGINLVNRANYTRTVTYPVTWTNPTTTTQITLQSGSWTPYVGSTITFDSSNSVYNNDIETVCYDYDYNSGFDQCISKDGTNDCGLPSCFINQNPETYDLTIGFADYDSNQIFSKAWDIYNYSGYDLQTYQFRVPNISPVINWLSDNLDVKKTEDITFNTIGSTSENSISSICMDIDNDGSTEQCETLVGTTFTIEYSNVNDYNVHSISVEIIDSQGFSEEINSTFSFRDLENVASIRKIDSSVDIGIYINETGWITFDGANSNVEDVHYVCYDYTNNGTYNKCYSNVLTDTQCGLSCEYTPVPLNGLINISYTVLNEYADFDLKLLVGNDNTESTDLYAYGIFLDSPETWFLPKIVSTDNDDDVNNDFVIDLKDQTDLRDDIPEDKLWTFEWTGYYSNYLYEPDFSCWGNSITGVIETCYSLDGGFNKFCGINCTVSPWWSAYSINSSLPYDSKNTYGVTLVLGSLDRNVASYFTQPFRFNPPVQEDIDAMRGFIIVAIVIIIIFVIVLALIYTFGFLNILIFVGLILRTFSKKKEDETEEE
jgi:hypothetical protein